MAPPNFSKEAQDKVKFNLVIHGVADWQALLSKTIQLNEPWSEWCGGLEVPLITYLRKEAELNVVSFERSVMDYLMSNGYTLEELEVEFRDAERAAWGKCVWYKEHPRYLEPMSELFKGQEKWANLFCSMFKTEHAGDQEFCVLSMQMFAGALIGQRTGILMHKTLIYHKAVFSLPKTSAVAA
jgi:hypothetical protein